MLYTAKCLATTHLKVTAIVIGMCARREDGKQQPHGDEAARASHLLCFTVFHCCRRRYATSVNMI